MILHAREKSHEYDDIKDQNDRPWNLECTKLFDKLRVMYISLYVYKNMDYHLVTNLRIKKVTAHLFIFPYVICILFGHSKHICVRSLSARWSFE